MELVIRPIEKWPGEMTKARKNSPFFSNYTQTLTLLDRGLNHLRVSRAVVQLAVKESELRLDGSMRANTAPSHPGVILSFESKHGPLSYPCDQFTHWHTNLRAIALSLEHLRAVDRYGVTRRGEQYKGWQQLPSPEDDRVGQAKALLRRHSGIEIKSSDDLSVAYRLATLATHPDRGGSTDEFREVVLARDFLAGAMGVGA